MFNIPAEQCTTIGPASLGVRDFVRRRNCKNGAGLSGTC